MLWNSHINKQWRAQGRIHGYRVDSLESGHEVMVQAVEDVQDTIKNNEEVLNSYRDQLDDYENRDRWQNIHIKRLPKNNSDV